MGLCNSKTVTQAQGNLVVDGFVRYAQGKDGWSKEKGQDPAHRDDVHLEVLRNERPLGTWRGHIYVENAILQDCLSYIHYKLGVDEFELLANDEDESIYREIFDFDDFKRASMVSAAQGITATPSSPIIRHKVTKNVGDHRSDNTERLFEVASVAQDTRKQSTTTKQVHRKTLTGLTVAAYQEDEDEEDEEDETSRNNSVVPFDPTGQNVSATSLLNSAAAAAGAMEESSDDDEDVVLDTLVTPAAPSPGVTNWLGLHDASTAALPAPTSKSGRNYSAKRSSKLRASDRKLRQSAEEDGDGVPQRPKMREMIFKRQDFKLEGDTKAVVSIAQSTKYTVPKNRLINGSVARANIRMRGALVEEFNDRKRPRCKVTFMCSMDPNLAEWETGLVSSEALSAFGGKSRVERFLIDMLEFFDSPSNRLIFKFRHLAGANTNEFNWQEVKRTLNELQLGTNVRHRKHGHGIVQSFDMKGRVRVVYDSKEVVDHPPEEKDELKVSVLIGTRVKHREKGFGTVKAFDESGRVHVKFDNGEMHRYKQQAWKKKMHTVKLVGIGGALGTVQLSWRPSLQVREGMGRVKFAVGVSTSQVLDYILKSNTQSSEDEIKSKSIIERRVVEQLNANERIIYECRAMPPPLASRDFVFKEIWSEVAHKTFAVVYETVERKDIPEKPQTVRGLTYLTGWLLEPLYLEEENTQDGQDHVCRVTYQLCIDTRGFVAPDAVEAVRQSLLLGAVTDMRAYYWEQSQSKQNAKLVSKFSPEQQQALNVGALKGISSMANVLS